MGVVQKQGFWSAIYTYTGIALGFINMVWLFPNILGANDFGLVRVILSASMLISKFGEFGLSSSVNKFFSYFRNTGKAHYGFLTFIFVLTGIVNLILICFLLLFEPYIVHFFDQDASGVSNNIFIIISISIILTLNEILTAYSRSNQKAVFPAFTKETLLRVLQLGSILIYTHGNLSLAHFLVLFVSTYCLQLLILIAYLKIRNLLVLSLKVSVDKIINYKEIITYSFFMFLNKLPYLALNQIDILMLGALAGLADAGKYFIAFSFAEVIRVPAKNIVQISNPIIADAWRRDDLAKISKMYYQSSINLLLIGGFILSLIVVNLEDLIFFLDKEYQDLYSIVLLIGVSKLFDMLTGINGTIIQTSKHYKYSMCFNLTLLLLAVTTNFIFIPKYGMFGAALSTAISVFLLNTMKYFFVLKVMKLNPFRKNTLYGIILILVIYAIGTIVPTPDIMMIDVLIRSSLICVVFFPVVYYFRLSNELRGNMERAVKKVSDVFL